MRDVSHRFGRLEALADVSLELAPGETVALVGPSGCGKSTLLELIGGLATAGSGEIAVGDATSVAGRLACCAWMPQHDALLPWRSAIDNAALGVEVAGLPRRRARREVAPIFERLGLAGFEASFPAELSGGMRQRVAFARTLVSGRGALLLDEPFAALDAITRADLQEWIAGVLREEERTTILVTHDVEEAIYLADRVAVMSPRPGRIHWQAPSPVDRANSRRETVLRPEFVAARERALAALAESREPVDA